MPPNPANPLFVQSDQTLLLDVHSPAAEAARAAIMPFAELEKSPEHIHTYRITPLSLWNAASAGLSPATIGEALNTWTKYPVPQALTGAFADTMARYGKIKLKADSEGRLLLVAEDAAVHAEIAALKSLERYLVPTEGGFLLRLMDRGSVKRELIKRGWPVQDEAPLIDGERLELAVRTETAGGLPFAVRDYQIEAAHAALGDGAPGTGYGVISLPCGSGKTVVGIQAMAMLQTNTLILTTNTVAVHQWMAELLDKTTLEAREVAEYSGMVKRIAPVTVATYQILTWRPKKGGDFPHFNLFRARRWGLIIYDEVHMLPAPVFRVTAELQALRRLGLTATLVREDHEEDAVFSLVGPKRYDAPWKDLEHKGWIATAICTEIRLDLPEALKIPYAVAPPSEKYRLASENPLKEELVLQLTENHPDDQILVIGQYIDQLESLARLLRAPLITGRTAQAERERIYAAFRTEAVRIIVVSKVANFAIDLPDASMAIQVSGSFGSRQEEAQRLGRIVRPKAKNALFFTLVSRYTVEETFAVKRQEFLAEQGYTYRIQEWES
jgi:DNA excision repair protein ERCC-3